MAEDGTVTFRFDFGGEASRDIKLPDSTTTYLKNKNRSDRTLVHRKNQVKTKKVDGRTLRVKSEVQLQVNESGITGIRAGDLKVSALGWRDVELHTEQHPGKTATEGDYPVLKTDPNGSPIIKDNHYQVQQYDDWVVMVVHAFGTHRSEVGIPPLTK